MRFLLAISISFASLFGQAQEHQEAYILKSIYFGGGSFYIDEEQFFELKHLVDSIPELKDYTITVHSHTDNIGGAAYNEWLSEMRSRAAIESLLNLDFKFNQIEIKDFGQFNPVYDNSPTGYGYDRLGERFAEISPMHNLYQGMPPIHHSKLLSLLVGQTHLLNHFSLL